MLKSKLEDFSKNPIWMYISVTLFIVVILILLKGSPLIKSGKTKEVSIKEYKNSKYGFSLRYLDNWKIMNDKRLAKLQDNFIFALSKTNSEAFIGIKIQKTKASKVKLKEVADILDNDLAKNFNNFSKISQEIIFLQSGQKVLKYNYSFNPSEGSKIWEQLVIIPTPKKVFYITSWSNFNDSNEIKKDIEIIISSFKIL